MFGIISPAASVIRRNHIATTAYNTPLHPPYIVVHVQVLAAYRCAAENTLGLNCQGFVMSCTVQVLHAKNVKICYCLPLETAGQQVMHHPTAQDFNRPGREHADSIVGPRSGSQPTYCRSPSGPQGQPRCCQTPVSRQLSLSL